MYCIGMMFIFTICCLGITILLGIVTLCCGFRNNGMPGVFYTLLISGGTVFWSLIGPSIVLSLPFMENWCRIVTFLIWESVIFLPWLILCRNKYKVSEPGFSRIGISGIFTQLSFLIWIALMLTKENLQEVLEYDIGRFCGCLLLLFTVPAFILTALAFSFKKKSWQCPDTTLALAAWSCALFFFFVGLLAMKVTA